MDRTTALEQLPEVYARALRLAGRDIDENTLAQELGVEPQAIGPLLRLAEAKLTRLLQSG